MVFKRAVRRVFEPGDSFSPGDNKDIPLLVQVVEFTDPIETYWTKKNDEDPKPAVKVHVIDIGERRPEVKWNVLWFGQHHDMIDRMIDDGDFEIGETFLMRFEDVPKKQSKGTYVSIVEPTEDDEEDAKAFEKEYGDLFAEGPPKAPKAEARSERPVRSTGRPEPREGRGERSARAVRNSSADDEQEAAPRPAARASRREEPRRVERRPVRAVANEEEDGLFE